MNILYKCQCMKAEASITVTDRREDEDIRLWMGYVTEIVSADHRHRNPICLSDTMEYVKIPIHDNTPVGANKKVN